MGRVQSAARGVADAVDGPRVLRRLDELAAIGAVAGQGITRIAFSPDERRAMDLVSGWMREADLSVAFDPFGSMFGSTDGNLPGARVSLAGSHLDTVPNGGRLDGALGVVAAIESVLAMRASGRIPAMPLEVVSWRCEEPVRFSQGKVGSMLFSGLTTLDRLQPIEQPPFDLNGALAAEEERPQRESHRTVAGCLELHIEQGQVLERTGTTIGVVTAIAAPIRLRIEIRGSADHSGATPMGARRDALCAAAEIVLAVERAGRDEAPRRSVATSANLACRPGAMNVIPGEATILVDVRGIDGSSMERIVQQIETAAATIGRRRGVEVDVGVLSRGVPTVFEEWVVERLQKTVRALGHEPMLMPSGAGHDVQCVAALAPAGMLFVPSVRGLSHCPEEHTEPEDLIAGVRALAASWWSLTETVGERDS